MAIKIENSFAVNLYVGSTAVDKVYVGSTLAQDYTIDPDSQLLVYGDWSSSNVVSVGGTVLEGSLSSGNFLRVNGAFSGQCFKHEIDVIPGRDYTYTIRNNFASGGGTFSAVVYNESEDTTLETIGSVSSGSETTSASFTAIDDKVICYVSANVSSGQYAELSTSWVREV